MSKMLAIISVAALALCAVLLGGGWLLGGDNVFHDPRSMEGLKPLIDLATRKEWRWAGGDTLALDAPVTVHYEPQGKPHVTITGPADAMDHIRFRAGRITSDVPPPPRNKDRLQAVVSGVPIRKFVVNGGENLQLGHIDQDELTLHINGGGMVGGDGKVRDLTLVMNGPGEADLGALQVGDANVSILGPGQVTLSPHGALKLFAVGDANVTLLSKPANFQRRIFGGATVQTPDGTQTAPPRETPPVPPRDATPAIAAPTPMPVPRGGGAGSTAGHDAGAPRNRVFVRGNDNINLGHIDQDRLIVDVTNSGSVTAEGRVDRLEVHIMGPGNANLGALTARQVSVDIAGAGNAIVAPTESVKANIAGSGNVRLTTKPSQIERHIIGSGRVIEAR
jgi:hypothetical protein